MIITPKSLTITQLLSAESEQYVVPAYQRRYSWHEKQLWEFLDDISLLEGSDTHLLGSIVCLTGYHKAGINELELVDGQQRLTTICILLQCIADRFKKDGETSAAQDVDRLTDAELSFVLGHEIGHLRFRHYRMQMVPLAFGKDDDGDSKVPALLARRLEIWQRLAELSADRAVKFG